MYSGVNWVMLSIILFRGMNMFLKNVKKVIEMDVSVVVEFELKKSLIFRLNRLYMSFSLSMMFVVVIYC